MIIIVAYNRCRIGWEWAHAGMDIAHGAFEFITIYKTS